MSIEAKKEICDHCGKLRELTYLTYDTPEKVCDSCYNIAHNEPNVNPMSNQTITIKNRRLLPKNRAQGLFYVSIPKAIMENMLDDDQIYTMTLTPMGKVKEKTL